jgi:hypothetical protein
VAVDLPLCGGEQLHQRGQQDISARRRHWLARARRGADRWALLKRRKIIHPGV